jgi:predicted GH43/DUF377 family glycosyl hydrolase
VGLPQENEPPNRSNAPSDDPVKLLDRTEQPFFKPEMPFEKSVQYAAGSGTFVEGLVQFQNRWIIYGGCADSLVGVALDDSASTR